MRCCCVFVLLVLTLGGCAAGPRMAPRPARINHFVLVKLRNPADAPAAIADCNASLATIPGVVAFAAGAPIDTGRSDAVTADYDVGLFIGFMTEADYAVYVDHPCHTALVERWRPRVEWIRVYDVLDETP
jgi:hypothetical protein